MKATNHKRAPFFKSHACKLASLLLTVMFLLTALIGCEPAIPLTGTTSGTSAAITDEPPVEYTKIGVASACTNPPEGLDMSGFYLTGFGNINRNFAGIHDDLEMSCVAIDMNGQKLAFISADTLGWDKDLTDELRNKVETELGVDADALMFNASHTHSAFNTLTNTLGLGYYKKEYSDFFYETAFETIKKAFEDLEDGELYAAETSAPTVAISRRAIINGVCYWQPSEKDPRSDMVSVIQAKCGDKIKAILFSFACHPSTLNGNYASADYVGEARKKIENAFEGSTAVFIQGCGADIKTRVTNTNMSAFRAGTYEDIALYGSRLGSAVIALCNGRRAATLEKLSGSVSCEMARFDIPLQENTRTKDDYKKLLAGASGVLVEVYKWYYDNFDNLPTSKPYSIQKFDLGDTLTVFALEGEVVVEYDGLLRALLPDRQVIAAGYSNGEIGYICVKRMYEEGGYEPERSCDYYGIPEGFVPEIEDIIMEQAQALCE